MMELPEIPNEERRTQLQQARTTLEEVAAVLSTIDPLVDGVDERRFREAEETIDIMHSTVEDELASIPQWDEELVLDIVLENLGGPGTGVRIVDDTIVHSFTAGGHGNSLEAEYTVQVGTGQEALSVDTGTTMQEVWRS
jgi:phosphoglycerate-specific signal transduction histidine kinase